MPVFTTTVPSRLRLTLRDRHRNKTIAYVFEFRAKIEPGVKFRVRRDEVEGRVDSYAVLEAAQPHARIPSLRHVLLTVGRGHADTFLKKWDNV